MAIPPLGVPGDPDGEPAGDSYGGVLIASGDEALAAVLEVLRGIRFSGWVAPAQGGWLVVLGDPGAGVVASDRRGIIEVGELLAGRMPEASAFAVRVRRDRQLSIVAWQAGEERGRYCSDPSQEPGAEDDVLGEPVGAYSAADFAELAARPDAAEELTEMLEEELDPDSVFESERLRGILRLLGMPDWLVAAGALPHDIPTGPRASELTRLRAGATSGPGILRSAFVRGLRRRRTPAPTIADPPRNGGMDGLEPWMF
ncbi:hypothetical protein ABZ477_05085 [Microbacterium sp. NPDC019599]|uniref:hypothetical protein n=1 Tax=Microbacterium sp. NPDC019599 TaxID=3154690 RepID=UPI0033C59124